MSATPWIVCKNGGPCASTMDCVCQRCGARLPIGTPVEVSEWCAATEAFVERHAACPQPQPKEEKPAATHGA